MLRHHGAVEIIFVPRLDEYGERCEIMCAKGKRRGTTRLDGKTLACGKGKRVGFEGVRSALHCSVEIMELGERVLGRRYGEKGCGEACSVCNASGRRDPLQRELWDLGKAKRVGRRMLSLHKIGP